MRRFVVPVWTSVIIILGGIWTAIVPFVGPLILGSSSSISMAPHGMGMSASTAMFLGIAVSTYVYHIIPGGVVALVGLYQLVLGLLRERRPAPSPTVERRVQEA
jgi:hypothetical protein